MTLSQHPELPDYYTSSYGDWEFSLTEDASIADAKVAIHAWTEWLEFLVDQRDKLF